MNPMPTIQGNAGLDSPDDSSAPHQPEVRAHPTKQKRSAEPGGVTGNLDMTDPVDDAGAHGHAGDDTCPEREFLETIGSHLSLVPAEGHPGLKTNEDGHGDAGGVATVVQILPGFG